MAKFRYKAIDPNGRSREGLLEAASISAVTDDLRGRRWLVVDIRQSSESTSSLRRFISWFNPLNWLPPGAVDVSLGLQQIAVMLRSGLTLLAALRTAAEQARRSSMSRVFNRIADRIQAGSSFADAMERHKCFRDLVVQLVRVGEQSGTIDLVLTRASEIVERSRRLRMSVLTALLYPAFVVVMSLGVTAFMLVFVMPKIRTLLTSLGRRLPAMTQSLIDISDYIQAYFGYGIIFVIVALVVYLALYSYPPIRRRMDWAILQFPLIGTLFRLSGTVMMARGLSILIRSGVSLTEGLNTIQGLLGNSYLSHSIARARETVMQGGSLSESLDSKGAFMPMLTRMMAVGESTGDLDTILETVAEFGEQQLQSMIQLFATVIEPIIIIVVGGIVGFVYISFFLALFSVSGSVG